MTSKLFLMICVGWVAATSAAVPADDLTLIKQRLRERYLAEWAPGSAAMEVEVPQKTADLVARLDRRGAWPDLDYDFPVTTGQVGFKAFPHVARVRKLAAAYAVATGAERDALRDAIHRGLSFWIRKDPQTGHHWFVEIGAPIELGKAAILFEAELTAEERAGVVRLMRISRRADGTLFYATRPATGQNLVWEAGLQIVAGCLAGEADDVARYATRAEQEMQPAGVEGVQVDWSFHQHGPQLSSAAYGVPYVNDCARWLAVLHGTAFAFAPATEELIGRSVLDGCQWMIRGHSWDFSPTARNIVWPRVDASEILPACEELVRVEGPRREELQGMIGRLRGVLPAGSAPTGNRLFWTSDYMTQASREFYASVKMSSRRTFGNESGNGQGEKTNYHLGDGAVCLMGDGGEYRGIFPLWNWRRVPGVTCVYPDDPQPPLPANTWGFGSEGGSDFAGGVSDRELGAAAMELDRAGAKARKAWFFLPNAVVCLGADIGAQDPAVPVVTSVEQCWARGEVHVADRADLVGVGQRFALNAPAWIYHHGVVYAFPQGGNLWVERQTKRATWQSINTLTGFKEPAEGEVLSLWFDHGRGRKDGTYAYIVGPAGSATQAATFAQQTCPRVLANNRALQAVTSASGDVVQIVFWEPGEAVVADGVRVTASAPCVLQLRRGSAGGSLAVGDPTHRTKSVHLVLTPTHGDRRELTLDFPAGAYAGSSVLRTLSW